MTEWQKVGGELEKVILMNGSAPDQFIIRKVLVAAPHVDIVCGWTTVDAQRLHAQKLADFGDAEFEDRTG